MDLNRIIIPPITLHWSSWIRWKTLEPHARSPGGVAVPNGRPGVYEVRRLKEEERLTIGKAADIRHRVKQCLVRGKGPHPAGLEIRSNEDVSQLEVRWAETDRPAAVEEELHRRHREHFGRLPRYTIFT